MTANYDKVWNTMNELEMVTSKISSAREILDSAIDALENHKKDKAETLMYAVDEYLQYYLEEFDRKFKDAWEETVTKLKQEEVDDYMPPWGHSDMEALSQYTDKELFGYDEYKQELFYLNYPPQSDDLIVENEPQDYYENVAPSATQRDIDRVVKWRLPVEEVQNGDTMETDYFITFPDDLLEAANLSPGDEVEWVEQEVGTFLLRKVEKTLLNHDEAITAGWNMTDDGFWVKE